MLNLVRVSHHEVEVCVAIDGGTHTAVVVEEFVLSYL